MQTNWACSLGFLIWLKICFVFEIIEFDSNSNMFKLFPSQNQFNIFCSNNFQTCLNISNQTRPLVQVKLENFFKTIRASNRTWIWIYLIKALKYSSCWIRFGSFIQLVWISDIFINWKGRKKKKKLFYIGSLYIVQRTKITYSQRILRNFPLMEKLKASPKNNISTFSVNIKVYKNKRDWEIICYRRIMAHVP